MDEYRNIGKIVAAFGVKGELVLHHHLGKKTSLKGLEAIFLEEKKDEMIPYFIRSARIKDEESTWLMLEGIDTREQAAQVVQKEVWLPEAVFEKYAGKSAPISLVGFHLINDGESLGPILEVIEQPHQVLCRIEWKGKEALIPLHEATLQKIDRKKKKSRY